MSKIRIDRRPKRQGLLIPMTGNKTNPNLVFPLYDIDSSELDELIRAILEKQGVTDEAEIHAVIEKAENDSFIRLKIAEAKVETRRLMKLRKQGKKLMSFGHGLWKEAHYPAVNKFYKD